MTWGLRWFTGKDKGRYTVFWRLLNLERFKNAQTFAWCYADDTLGWHHRGRYRFWLIVVRSGVVCPNFVACMLATTHPGNASLADPLSGKPQRGWRK
jgi:hypothetical protein